MNIAPPFPSVEKFLFEAPLYTKFALNDDLEHVKILCGRAKDLYGVRLNTKLDGHCPFCKRDTTFNLNTFDISDENSWKNVRLRDSIERLSVTCARNHNHVIRYFFRLQRLIIQKVGQHPSLADIAINETRQKYKSVLKGDNWAELYKAIGLAAHGEGIGSFVYLRRVFERLIQVRFNEFKESKKWNDEEFNKLRMDERVQFLKEHLPPFLYEARKIYSIFSQGIHELDNDACLTFFEIGKRSIIMVLEDDLKHQQEIQARKELSEAISKFSGS